MATDNSVRTLTQTKLFIVALTVGGLSVLVGKLASGPYIFGVFAILMPIAIMIAYAVFNHRVGFLDSTRAQVADNSYFLGFLFFLISLAITLAQVSAGDDRRVEVEPIIRGFGVALATTIVGLLLRIVILQNIAGLTSARERAEESLLNAVNRFERHIEVSLDLLSKARDGIVTTSASTAEVVQRTLVALAESTKQTTDAATKGYVDGLLTASRAASDELSSALANFKTKIAELKLPSDALTAAIAPQLTALQKAVTDVNVHTTDLGAGVASTASQIKKIPPAVAKLSTALTVHVEGVETALSRLSATQEAMQALEQKAHELSKALDGLGARVALTNESLGAVPEVSGPAREALIASEKAAKALKDTVGATVVSVANDAKAAADAAANLRSSAQQLVSSAQTSVAGIRGEIELADAAIRKLQGDLDKANARPWWRVGGS